MEITIKAIHFEASEKLEAFIRKKVERMEKFRDVIQLAEITLKVIKPETNANKDASIKIFAKGKDFFSNEVSDTFEDAINRCVEKLERQIVKSKEKKSGK
ncbi:MAG: ribosome-associated translation inhibitor RaiA [Dysgonamonadaceae bacterium]|jgi:putative sigma-54 modulation protein|nr:ribosome-associated translation inhibitor RaiA [Dysgonamonadaceae bacterium]